jgi:hypothetical protein
MSSSQKLNATQITSNSVQSFKISEIIERGKNCEYSPKNKLLIMKVDIIFILDMADVQLGVILKPEVFGYVVADLSAGALCLASSVKMLFYLSLSKQMSHRRMRDCLQERLINISTN